MLNALWDKLTKGARRQEVNVVYTKERGDLNHFSGLSANASQQDLNRRGARTSIGPWAKNKGYVYTLLSRGKNRTSGNQGALTQVRFAKTACFVAGTKVWLHDYSTIKIENIRPGMLVRSKDVKSNREVIGQVDHIITKKASTLIEIYTPLDTFLVTPEHPFYIDGAWVTAGKLKKGQTLTLLDQPRLFASSSYDLSHPKKTYIDRIVVKDTTVTVYNFSVTKYHNYYVGNVGILVHNNNACMTGVEGLAKWVIEIRKDRAMTVFNSKGEYYVDANRGIVWIAWVFNDDGNSMGEFEITKKPYLRNTPKGNHAEKNFELQLDDLMDIYESYKKRQTGNDEKVRLVEVLIKRSPCMESGHKCAKLLANLQKKHPNIRFQVYYMDLYYGSNNKKLDASVKGLQELTNAAIPHGFFLNVLPRTDVNYLKVSDFQKDIAREVEF